MSNSLELTRPLPCPTKTMLSTVGCLMGENLSFSEVNIQFIGDLITKNTILSVVHWHTSIQFRIQFNVYSETLNLTRRHANLPIIILSK